MFWISKMNFLIFHFWTVKTSQRLIFWIFFFHFSFLNLFFIFEFFIFHSCGWLWLLGKRDSNMSAEGKLGERYPNMGAEGCLASAIPIWAPKAARRARRRSRWLVCRCDNFRVILSLVPQERVWPVIGVQSRYSETKIAKSGREAGFFRFFRISWLYTNNELNPLLRDLGKNNPKLVTSTY